MRKLAVGLLCLLALGCKSPEPFVLDAQRPLSAEPVSFRAGYAERAFTPEPGYPLGGFGGGERREEWPFLMGLGFFGRLSVRAHMWYHREGEDRRTDFLTPAEGVLDPLTARALVLRPDDQAPVALVRIDAIGTTMEVHQRVAEAVADLGYTPDGVVISATHTHSGMGAFMRVEFGCMAAMDNFRPELEDALVEACADSIRAAHEGAKAARLGFGRARDRSPEGHPVVSKNRRARQFREEIRRDQIDDEIGLLLVESVDGDEATPLALLVNYAIHGTVLGQDNLCFSADVTGGIERALTRRLDELPVLYFNGAEGDIGPSRITPGSQGIHRCNELGEAFADLVAPVVSDISTHERIAVATAMGHKEFGRPYTQVAAGRGRFLDAEEGIGPWLTWPLGLPVNVIFWVLGIDNVRFQIQWNASLGVVLDLGGLVERTTARLGGLRIVAGDEDVAWLTIPGEATHDVGLAMRSEAAARGATRSFVVGLSQDHIGYIASPTEYRRGGYEAISTLFGPSTSAQMREAHTRLLDALGYGPPSEGPDKK